VRLYELNWRFLLLGEHCYLDTTDECYFTGEYERCCGPGMKPQILSLKRSNECAIAGLARQLATVLPREWTSNYTFVPMPSSSRAINPLRLMLRRLDIRDTRDLLVQLVDTPPSHNGWRPMPQERAKLLTLHEREVDPEPKAVVIVDDVLATGSHFRAAKMIVRKRWPHMRVIGVFLARACWRRRVVMREPPQLQTLGPCCG
jgi:predicted amidophosphoribosyltransferase